MCTKLLIIKLHKHISSLEYSHICTLSYYIILWFNGNYKCWFLCTKLLIIKLHKHVSSLEYSHICTLSYYIILWFNGNYKCWFLCYTQQIKKGVHCINISKRIQGQVHTGSWSSAYESVCSNGSLSSYEGEIAFPMSKEQEFG